MSELFFCIKTFVLTVAIVMAMQIQVGERTIENHAMSWVQTSPLIRPLNNVAHGAARMWDDLMIQAREQAANAKRKITRQFN